MGAPFPPGTTIHGTVALPPPPPRHHDSWPPLPAAITHHSPQQQSLTDARRHRPCKRKCSLPSPCLSCTLPILHPACPAVIYILFCHWVPLLPPMLVLPPCPVKLPAQGGSPERLGKCVLGQDDLGRVRPSCATWCGSVGSLPISAPCRRPPRRGLCPRPLLEQDCQARLLLLLSPLLSRRLHSCCARQS